MKLPIPDQLKLAAVHLREAIFPIGRRHFFGQNAEDAELQVLLGDKIRSGPPGFYVDVGAFSPKQFSNTYWFYRRGWQGINIDATPGSMRPFRVIRPRDINLECAVSDEPGELTFYSLGLHTVLNTASPDVAEQWGRVAGRKPKEVRVRARTLREILEEHLPAGREIDFLSVDVEGHDLNVLKSNDWLRFRPAIVIAEDHKEDVDAIRTSEITSFLSAHGYGICAWAPPSVFYRRLA